MNDRLPLVPPPLQRRNRKQNHSTDRNRYASHNEGILVSLRQVVQQTRKRRPNQTGDSLEEQQQAKGIRQLLQPEQIHQDHRSQTHIRADREAKDDRVDDQGGIVLADDRNRSR